MGAAMRADGSSERTGGPIGAMIMIVAGAVTAIGAWLPWATYSSGPVGGSVRGFVGWEGKVALVAGLAILIRGFLLLRSEERRGGLAVLSILSGLAAAGVSGYTIVTLQDHVNGILQLGGIKVSPAAGIYVVLAGGIVAVAGAVIALAEGRGSREMATYPALDATRDPWAPDALRPQATGSDAAPQPAFAYGGAPASSTPSPFGSGPQASTGPAYGSPPLTPAPPRDRSAPSWAAPVHSSPRVDPAASSMPSWATVSPPPAPPVAVPTPVPPPPPPPDPPVAVPAPAPPVAHPAPETPEPIRPPAAAFDPTASWAAGPSGKSRRGRRGR